MPNAKRKTRKMIGRIVAASNEDARRRMTLEALNYRPPSPSEFAGVHMAKAAAEELRQMGIDPRDGRS